MNADGPSPASLPGQTVTRIHALWDEVADFGAQETHAALGHALRALSELVGAQNAFWLGAVRLGIGFRPARRVADARHAAIEPDRGGRARL